MAGVLICIYMYVVSKDTHHCSIAQESYTTTLAHPEYSRTCRSHDGTNMAIEDIRKSKRGIEDTDIQKQRHTMEAIDQPAHLANKAKTPLARVKLFDSL